MDTGVLKHPRIAGIVDSLVSTGGGRLTYDTGCGGREILIAASARLAAEAGSPLTIVEARVLHSEIRSFVDELQPDVPCAVLSADEAALQPDGGIAGVLAVHAGVLRDPDVRQPLLAMAYGADQLVVVRHDYSDTTLDSLATPGLVLTYLDLMPAVTPAPGPRPGVREQREAATRPERYVLDPARRRTSPSSEERKERFIARLNRTSDHEDEELADVMDADPDEVRTRLDALMEQMQDRSDRLREQKQQQDDQFREQVREQRLGDPAPPLSAAGNHEHGQGQSTAHQQLGTQGPGRA
ncbi:hypothetical protein ACFWGI_06475 [Streptomyces niveus]|uniref:hypothetical protein n=1 Tax=Streptomyces niveus TaxID=193462 RepID=UPI003648D45F